jgi:hypothetical protein
MSTYNDVKQFNERCGKSPEKVGTVEYWASLQAQLDLILEELKETQVAINDKDLTELVDGGADMDVTVAGLNFLSGSLYQGAIKTVCSNNNSKYSTDRTFVYEEAERYEGKGIEVYVNEYKENSVDEASGELTTIFFYCIRLKKTGKIMKFFNHEKVGLDKFVPKPVIQYYLVVRDLSDTGTIEYVTKKVGEVTVTEYKEGNDQVDKLIGDSRGVLLKSLNCEVIEVESVEKLK